MLEQPNLATYTTKPVAILTSVKFVDMSLVNLHLW